jgi:hypothetical protein
LTLAGHGLYARVLTWRQFCGAVGAGQILGHRSAGDIAGGVTYDMGSTSGRVIGGDYVQLAFMTMSGKVRMTSRFSRHMTGISDIVLAR